MSTTGQLLKAGIKNWKWLLGAGVVGHAYANDQSVIKSTADGAAAALNIRKEEGETLIGATVRSFVDAGTTEGTTDRVLEKFKGTAQEVGDSVSQVSDATREMASKGSDGLFGGISNLFSGLTGGISSLFGGGGSGLNLGAAAMLPLAWFTFGKFGWIGKVGALAMLMYGLSNLFNRQEPAVQQAHTNGYGGGDRQLPTAKDNYDNLVRADERQGQVADQDFNVRAKY